MVPSKYQKRFFRELTETNNNIVISAVAGSGKTTTIVEGVKLLPKDKRVLFLAFNNSIVNELKERLPQYAYVSTLHSFGFKCCIKSFGKITVAESKIFKIAEELGIVQKWFKESEKDKKLGEYCFELSQMTNLVRLNLDEEFEEYKHTLNKHGHIYDDNDLLRIKNIIGLANKRIGQFDFVDMIYQPAVRNIRMPKFDYLFVDELQDLNRAQQVLVSKLLHPKGRFIGVGDPRQSIYGFAGADIESYDRMRNFFPNTIELPLSVCYRSGKNIVIHAQEINPNIEYWEKNEDGEVRRGKVEEIKQGDWVLCRNVKPLIFLFIYLLKQHKKAYIKGKDIGENLIKLIKKCTKKKNVSIEDLYKKLSSEVLQVRVKLLRRHVRKPDKHPAMEVIVEKTEVIKILANECNNSNEVIKKIESIFTEDKKEIMLSTIHKSKGLENDRIFVICPELIPSKFAVTKEQLKQEENLKYVMRTRAKKSLIYVTDFDSIVLKEETDG